MDLKSVLNSWKSQVWYHQSVSLLLIAYTIVLGPKSTRLKLIISYMRVWGGDERIDERGRN